MRGISQRRWRLNRPFDAKKRRGVSVVGKIITGTTLLEVLSVFVFYLNKYCLRTGTTCAFVCVNVN